MGESWSFWLNSRHFWPFLLALTHSRPSLSSFRLSFSHFKPFLSHFETFWVSESILVYPSIHNIFLLYGFFESFEVILSHLKSFWVNLSHFESFWVNLNQFKSIWVIGIFIIIGPILVILCHFHLSWVIVSPIFSF